MNQIYSQIDITWYWKNINKTSRNNPLHSNRLRREWNGCRTSHDGCDKFVVSRALSEGPSPGLGRNFFLLGRIKWIIFLLSNLHYLFTCFHKNIFLHKFQTTKHKTFCTIFRVNEIEINKTKIANAAQTKKRYLINSFFFLSLWKLKHSSKMDERKWET